MRALATPLALTAGATLTAAPLFRDRAEAGARLGRVLEQLRDKDMLVLGIPRGGVVVAAAVAKALNADLDVVVARKLGAPVSAELAIGAVTADGGRFLNADIIRELDVSPDFIERETRAQMAEAARREARYRGSAQPPQIRGRTVVLVEDGLATGATVTAAARSVRGQGPSRLIIAVPVGSLEACERLRLEADDVVCLATPDPFWAVGLHYRDFGQTEDAEVERLLDENRRNRQSPGASPSAASRF